MVRFDRRSNQPNLNELKLNRTELSRVNYQNEMCGAVQCSAVRECMFLSVSGKLRIGTAANMLLDEKDIREAQQ
jgi:hypothetical protein